MLGKYTIVLPWESYGSYGFPSTGGKNGVFKLMMNSSWCSHVHMVEFFFGGGLKGLL